MKKAKAPKLEQGQIQEQEVPDFEFIDLVSIRPSKKIYRPTKDNEALRELTASVKSKGVLQPILVRPLKFPGTYEMVAGRRRYAAASAAGHTRIPAIIKDLSDEDAFEVQVIENSQREDPNPMEEAWGFKDLLDMGKHTPDTLAAKLDRSIAYVLGRLKLLKLPKDAQEKIASEEISIGHALLLSRLSSAEDQKEFLEMISEHNGMTVREAKEAIEQFSDKLSDAVFNTAECETCDSLSRNQSILFPELQTTDECMDKACFNARTKAHYVAIINEKEAQGFQIIRKEEDIYKLKSSRRIAAPGSKKDYSTIVPKRYKSECAKCTESHAFYLYEKKYNWKTQTEICFGELCLNAKCLDKMENPRKKTDSGGEEEETPGQVSEFTRRRNAEECRNRFLRATLPEIMTTPNNSAQLALLKIALRDRLAIYHLLDTLDNEAEVLDVFKKYCPQADASDLYGAGKYRFIESVPVENLVEMMADLVIAGIQVTDPEVLLQMTTEAGIYMSTDFAVDETYLKTKTKDDLIAFAKDAELELDGISAGSKKGEIIEAILKHDLRGKLPADVAAVCKVKEEA